jgi:hypothetical protein
VSGPRWRTPVCGLGMEAITAEILPEREDGGLTLARCR